MTVKILHLFPTLMNLYGERGNILVLQKRLRESGIEVEVVTHELGDELSLDGVDVVYMGCGTESASIKALEALTPYKQAIEAYIEQDKILLLTGNAMEIFGKEITADTEHIDSLDIFTYSTLRTSKKRYLGDAIFTSGDTDSKIIGFTNKCSTISGVIAPLFNVEMGLGNDNKQSTEGFTHKNVFATSLIGPLLVRNPHFLQLILQKIFRAKDFEPQGLPDMADQMKAYSIALKELEASRADR